MTAKEAIEFIKKCSKDTNAPYGFMVVAISKEDIYTRFDDDVIDEFDKLSKKNKEKVLSNVAETMNEIYQDFCFENDFENTIRDNDFETLMED
jgi:hypothetical protein